MALRILTDTERQTLLDSEDFRKKCDWAARDYSVYWADNDGAAATTLEERIKWGKDRIIGVRIVTTDVNDPFIPVRFLNAGKGKEFELEEAPQPLEVLLEAWVTSNAFQEFVSEYFDILGETINFSVVGN